SYGLQYEGAAFEDGKGPSICDTYIHKYPDRSNGDVADDFYHRYKEDVQLMNYIGITGFRFTVSWPRVLPRKMFFFYVLVKVIIIFCQISSYSSFSNQISFYSYILHVWLAAYMCNTYCNLIGRDDFRDFAELCFKEFGDRVKHWLTFNEPWSFSVGGYDSSTFGGTIAPGRCSAWLNKGCPAGDSSTEPYLVAHRIILCHATAAKLYREKYKPSQKGQIGIVLITNWWIPYSNSKADALAAQRILDFFLGWFLDPLTFGDYPKSMRSFVGKRLPKFTEEQKLLIKGSLDFLGLNYYTSSYVLNAPYANSVNISYSTDLQVNFTGIRNGRPIGAPVSSFIRYLDELKLSKR
ncbi:unnamed protein product, partial [Coffea canephora]